MNIHGAMCCTDHHSHRSSLCWCVSAALCISRCCCDHVPPGCCCDYVSPWIRVTSPAPSVIGPKKFVCGARRLVSGSGAFGVLCRTWRCSCCSVRKSSMLLKYSALRAGPKHTVAFIGWLLCGRHLALVTGPRLLPVAVATCLLSTISSLVWQPHLSSTWSRPQVQRRSPPNVRCDQP